MKIIPELCLRQGTRQWCPLARREGRGASMRPMRPDIRPGGVFPDYELPDQLGTMRKLSELQGSDPLTPSTTP